MQQDYFGLVLGRNTCNLPQEYAKQAVDVDLSYYDIRPFGCPTVKCNVDGDCLGYVGDCCKGEYYYVEHQTGIIAIENGILSCADDPCSDHHNLAAPVPGDISLVPASHTCECGNGQAVIRYAEINCHNRIGLLSRPYIVDINTTVDFGHDVVVFAHVVGDKSSTGGWFCQGLGSSFSQFNRVESVIPPYSEGYCNPPENMKYLVRHKSSSLMAASGKRLHISHPVYPHLWDKYHIDFTEKIVSVQEEAGEVFVFDGRRVYAINQQQTGFDYSIIEDDVCVDSHKAITSYGGTLFAATRDGVKSLASNNYRRSSFGYIDEQLMNPAFMRKLNRNWRIGAFNSRLHFANDDRAFIFDLTGSKRALTESSMVPDDYYADCNGIYYLSEGVVYEWNAGDDCEYLYCTNRQKLDGCDNIGAIRVEGNENGGSVTSVGYSDGCHDEQVVCEQSTCLCKTMTITGCENTRYVSVCFKGKDIICNHELAKAPMELR